MIDSLTTAFAGSFPCLFQSVYLHPHPVLVCVSAYMCLSGGICMKAGVSDAVESAEKFSARNIANTLWALAKMMHNPGEVFLNSLGAEAGKKVTDFNAQNHANTVWAFATLGRLCAWHC